MSDKTVKFDSIRFNKNEFHKSKQTSNQFTHNKRR